MFSQLTGFIVEVVSEGGFYGIEYTVDGADSEALFLINGTRILGAVWWTGINVLILDPVYGHAISSEVCLISRKNH